MKKFLSSLFLLAVMAVMPVSAQSVACGVKGGVDYDFFSSDSPNIHGRYAWFVGPSVRLSLPSAPFAFDVSAFYKQRNIDLHGEDIWTKSIVIPVNARYNFKVKTKKNPEGNILFLAAGPQYELNVGNEKFDGVGTSDFQLNKSSLSLNLSVGASLKHFEMGVAYKLGLSDIGESIDYAYDGLNGMTYQFEPATVKVNALTIFFAVYF